MSYATHFILEYLSNAIFILILNLILTIIFSKRYSFAYYKEHRNTIRWVLAHQIFRFCLLYLDNYLSSNYLTRSCYVSTIVVVIILIFLDKDKKPTLKQILEIILVVTGIYLIDY